MKIEEQNPSGQFQIEIARSGFVLFFQAAGLKGSLVFLPGPSMP
jgi:hypothetical protein